MVEQKTVVQKETQAPAFLVPELASTLQTFNLPPLCHFGQRFVSLDDLSTHMV